ncbi:MAG: phytanoyl-CoA dioxygenase [Planctomycetaceae bacterium]|jgi:hypothetical protein|nr:phytanoyl-CoA dioxygenase [Planctomycetaceae bacterium]MBT6154428.1 phytanoyl-CoA dioxygenase [Planctomycetaceae bacterium]MBT6486229.1 phytanoyl-CoA dioxygenase [Planctomycetaceae bacterium]MBT6497586.1 phytanoyl-CoA dioxygenase [Planctomycetaceae bacterium]
MTDSAQDQIEQNGFAILAAVFGDDVVDQILSQLSVIMDDRMEHSESIRARSGAVYAARNVLEVFPPAADIWQTPRLLQVIGETLGPDFGLVRVLYFDKPPDRTWTLPWHKDLTITVRRPTGNAAEQFKIRDKAGVPHVDAPLEVLESMLTLRLHLDEVTSENGPLKVVTGSHRSGKRLTLDDGPQKTICVNRGDVLAMRPLVSHSSARSVAGTTRHRRILHFEFSGTLQLPHGLQWYRFIRPVI